jgi:hypothetical protein
MPSGDLKQSIEDHVRAGFAGRRTGSGISCMPAAVLTTDVNPEQDGRVATSNFPISCPYGPDVSNEDIGGGPPGGMGPLCPSLPPPRLIVESLGAASG